MTTLFDCTLGGVLLSSLDESICVLDLREDAPKLRHATAAAWHDGLHLLDAQRESFTVRVDFAIHTPDPARRTQVLQAVCAWAMKGGVLTASSHPGQQLDVRCIALPAPAADDWLAPLTLVFTTTTVPFWEDANLTQVSSSGAAALLIPGTAGAVPVSTMVVNNGDAPITRLTLLCGDTQMVFEGISVPANSMFVMTQVGPVLRAYIGGQSVLSCRTAESDDSLLAVCGKSCTVQAIASQPATSIFMARGRYV